MAAERETVWVRRKGRLRILLYNSQSEPQLTWHDTYEAIFNSHPSRVQRVSVVCGEVLLTMKSLVKRHGGAKHMPWNPTAAG